MSKMQNKKLEELNMATKELTKADNTAPATTKQEQLAMSERFTNTVLKEFGGSVAGVCRSEGGTCRCGAGGADT